MWLKKLVALSMIITLVGMNGIAIAGIFAPNKTATLSLEQPEQLTPPVVSLSADPPETAVGSYSALKWSVSGQVDKCQASGAWDGVKTPFGTQSTGRLPQEGTRTYTLTCSNQGGAATQSVKVAVTKSAQAATPSPTSPQPSPTPSPTAPVYCNGASPCFGPRDIAQHSSAGNCWGYNGNRVFNISGFDAAFHRTKSGVKSIEVSGVCGTDLAAALGGTASAGGQTRNHNNASKANADRNMLAYVVGYFDASKP